MENRKKIEMSDCKGVPALILQGVYSCADVCLSSLTLNLWEWLDVAGCDGVVGLGGIDGCLGGTGRRKACVYELETVVPSN